MYCKIYTFFFTVAWNAATPRGTLYVLIKQKHSLNSNILFYQGNKI